MMLWDPRVILQTNKSRKWRTVCLYVACQTTEISLIIDLEDLTEDKVDGGSSGQ